MTVFSESSSFKTLSASGLVEFSDLFVDQITSGSARFSVTVSSKVQVDSVSFVYGLDGSGENLKINAAKDGNLFTAQSSDLVERSDYSVTAIVVDDQGNRYQSSSASFRTLDAQSPFLTIDIPELDAHQATISVTLKEDVSINKCWFLLKDKTSQTSLQTEVSRDGQSPLVMTYSDLRSGTEYQFLAKIQTTSGEEFESAVLEFTTKEVQVEFSELSIEDVFEYGAVCKAKISSGSEAISGGFQYWKLGSRDTMQISSEIRDSSLKAELSGLESGVTYGLRAIAWNENGKPFHSQSLDFETAYDGAVQDLEVSDILPFSARFDFTVAYPEKVSDAWIVLRKSGASDSLMVKATLDKSRFSALAQGLEESSTYSCRAKIVTKDGKSHLGGDQSFQTVEQTPQFSMLETSSVTSFSAKLKVGLQQASDPQRVWFTLEKDGSGQNIELEAENNGTYFFAEAKGLQPGQTYYYQAHVLSRFGTHFQSERQSFQTVEADDSKVVEIPDEIFKQYLLRHYDKNGDGEISMKEAMEVDDIETGTEKIHSAVGIEYMPGIYHLHLEGPVNELHNGKLTEIDLTNNPGITTLVLSGNNLRRLDLSPIVDCDLVRIEGNLLEEVIFPKAMELLSISGNQMKKLDLRGYDTLDEVHCDWNPLEEILLDNENLRYIDLQGTSVKELDLTKCPRLEAVDTNYCQFLEKVYVKKGHYIGTLFNREGVHYEVIYVD